MMLVCGVTGSKLMVLSVEIAKEWQWFMVMWMLL